MSVWGYIRSVETGYHFCTFWVESKSPSRAEQKTARVPPNSGTPDGGLCAGGLFHTPDYGPLQAGEQ